MKVSPMVRGMFLLFVKYWGDPRLSEVHKSSHTHP